VVTAWSTPDTLPPLIPGAGRLRLVDGAGVRERRRTEEEGIGDRAEAPRRHRLTVEARRRCTLLAIMAVLLVVLALPLSGTGGYSHTTGSALAETGHSVVYTVRPGDTLWSIAARVDPSGDPRPLVTQLAAQTGSQTVVPGERIVLP
jgi:hypothetical protein